MKAPSAGFRIQYDPTEVPQWKVIDDVTGRAVWSGKTFRGARNAHYRLAVAKLSGKPVSAAQARRAGNA